MINDVKNMWKNIWKIISKYLWCENAKTNIKSVMINDVKNMWKKYGKLYQNIYGVKM